MQVNLFELECNICHDSISISHVCHGYSYMVYPKPNSCYCSNCGICIRSQHYHCHIASVRYIIRKKRNMKQLTYLKTETYKNKCILILEEKKEFNEIVEKYNNMKQFLPFVNIFIKNLIFDLYSELVLTFRTQIKRYCLFLETKYRLINGPAKIKKIIEKYNKNIGLNYLKINDIYDELYNIFFDSNTFLFFMHNEIQFGNLYLNPLNYLTVKYIKKKYFLPTEILCNICIFINE